MRRELSRNPFALHGRADERRPFAPADLGYADVAIAPQPAVQLSGDRSGDINVKEAHDTTSLCQIRVSGVGDTRNDSACPSSRRQSRFAGTSHAGGGTRTPDTRIMIPSRF